MSQLFKASLLLTVFFGINKLVALLRQVVIGREFGLNQQIDAFNVANNFPDLVVSLISGGALAFAFIPVLSQYKQNFGLTQSWKLFSHIANLVFLTTTLVSIVIAIFAPILVSAQWGIAPGFNPEQQRLVVDLMRLNLLATIIFSISGLFMASLHANKHFLLPAIAPILYNFGQIFGALVLSPDIPMHIGPIILPAFGMGVYGLGVGVILGSLLHLGIQIPALFKFKFQWSPILDLKDPHVQQVLGLMGPRIITVLLIHFIFIARDNLASRLQEGAVSALTYAYFIMQVPQTLIGTAIGTALLPTLSELSSDQKKGEFEMTLNRSIKVIIALTVAITVLLSIGLSELIKIIFGFSSSQTELLTWTTRAFLLGLSAQCLLEVVARAFYAKQNAKIPLYATILRAIIFIVLALVTFNSLGVLGIALADSISVTVEVVLLFVLLKNSMPKILDLGETLLRVGTGCLVSALIMIGVINYLPGPQLILILLGGTLASIVYLIFIRAELKMLLRL